MQESHFASSGSWYPNFFLIIFLLKSIFAVGSVYPEEGFHLVWCFGDKSAYTHKQA